MYQPVVRFESDASRPVSIHTFGMLPAVSFLTVPEESSLRPSDSMAPLVWLQEVLWHRLDFCVVPYMGYILAYPRSTRR